MPLRLPLKKITWLTSLNPCCLPSLPAHSCSSKLTQAVLIFGSWWISPYNYRKCFHILVSLSRVLSPVWIQLFHPTLQITVQWTLPSLLQALPIRSNLNSMFSKHCWLLHDFLHLPQFQLSRYLCVSLNVEGVDDVWFSFLLPRTMLS